jgi:hypothetical protein
MEQWERGYNYVGAKYVCPACVDDECLRAFILERATSSECSYCGTVENEAIASELDVVLGAFAAAIRVEWRDAIDEMPYEGDGWALPDANRTIYDLLGDGDLEVDVHPDLFDDIVRAFADRVFAPRNFFSPGPEDELNFSWQAFVEQVSHHTRYLFPLGVGIGRGELAGLRVPPEQMLAELGAMVASHQLLTSLPAGTFFARGRLHPRIAGDRPADAKALGTPRAEFATRSNRMSPNGIPMFYGGEDEETVIAEVTAAGWPPGHDLTIGWWETTRELTVVDFVELPKIPSLFDLASLDQRPALSFLHRFANEVSQPVSFDQTEHIEYVPTQIVTEYFRHAFQPEVGGRVDGIRYPSSVNDGGVCVVLFLEHEQCADDPEDMLGVIALTHAYSKYPSRA